MSCYTERMERSIDIEQLKPVRLTALDGTTRPLGELWSERPAVITWLRHYG